MQTKKIILSIIFLCAFSQYLPSKSIGTEDFLAEIHDFKAKVLIFKWISSWSISKELFKYVRKILPKGKTMLEMGSGWASEQFSKHYTVYSVEHNKKWVGKYNTNYIYAPIVNRWYNPNILEKELPKEYDLILIDGPPGTIGRGGFYNNLHLFNTDVTIIFDDINRKAEYDLMVKVSKKIKRGFKIYKDSFRKKFGVIEAKK